MQIYHKKMDRTRLLCKKMVFYFIIASFFYISHHRNHISNIISYAFRKQIMLRSVCFAYQPNMLYNSNKDTFS